MNASREEECGFDWVRSEEERERETHQWNYRERKLRILFVVYQMGGNFHPVKYYAGRFVVLCFFI